MNMKKAISVILIIMTVFLISCKADVTEQTTVENTESTSAAIQEATTVESLDVQEIEPASILCVYFSHLDPIVDIAEFISSQTKAKLLRIETVGEYPLSRNELAKKAAEEHSKGFRPALKNAPQNLIDYDIIFLCFPQWDSTMPMALFTFIEDYDMRDKAVIPVVYGGNTALDNAVNDIHSLVPSMMIVNGFTFTDELTDELKAELEGWMNKVLFNS